jgi:hypothetical protein
MGKLLTILGVTDQSNLTEDILTAENLIIGMQYIYENSPESEQKESLAIAIAETIRLTLQQIKGLPLTPPQAPKVINVVRILTESEFEFIYGNNWRTEVALDDKNHNADWVSPNMDKYLGTELTDKQLDDLNSKGYADLDVNKIFIATIFMTTLNPSYNKNGVQGGDNYESADGLFKFHIDGVVNGVVFYKQTDQFGVETDEQDNLNVINDLIDNGDWVKVSKQNTPITEIKVGQVYKTQGSVDAHYVILYVDNDEIEWIGVTNSNGTGQRNTRKETEDAISSGFWVLQPQLSVQVGDAFKHATEPKQETWEIYDIGYNKVYIKWGAKRNLKVTYGLQETITYIINGTWVKINSQQNTPTTPKSDTEPLFEIDDWVITDYGMVGKITDANGTPPNFTYDAVKGDGKNAFTSRAENTLKKIDLDVELKSLNVKVGNVFQIAQHDYLRIWEITQDKVITMESNGVFEQFNKDELIVFIIGRAIEFYKEGNPPLYKVGDVITWLTDKKNMTVTKIELDFEGDWYYYGTSDNGVEQGASEMFFDSTPKTAPKSTAKKGTRQSPITSATAVKEGTKMMGNDGNFWVARKTSAGYNQWKKIK